MGTPGHMAHPFDVERVRTGQDLIDFINDAVLRLRNKEITGSVKWDGINTSFKLITNDEGEKEFRMDRGTNHIDSVVGLTADDAYAKWPEGHGMPPAVEKLLNIFNAALPLIEPELKELRMWNDPTKYFNTEYIEGKSNVQEYAANILAIHGINQFYEKKAQPHAIRKGTSMDRPGLPRPIDPATDKPVRAGGIEIPYNKEALVSLIEKVQPIAEDYGFEVYGDVSVEFDPEGDLDLEKVLDTPIAIRIVPGGVETAPLREWLTGVVHPQDATVAKSDEWIAQHGGKKNVAALSKDVYMAVLRSATDEGVPLSQYLESQEDVKEAINGGIFYHATRLLGQAVKNALTSKAGNLGKHEGVVLRGMEDFLVKLTGDFIVQGLASTHGDKSKQSLTEHPLSWAKGLIYTESLLTEEVKRVIAIYPGRFQPMGRHHYQTFQKIANQYGLENTFIATSDVTKPGSPLNFEEKKLIMMKHGIPESQIVQTKNPYAAREILGGLDSNTTAVVYLVGAKDMSENPRFNNLDGVLKDGTPAHLRTLKDNEGLLGYNQHSYVGVAPHVAIDIPGVGEMCGTSLRGCLGDATPEEFEAIMGWYDEDVYEMLKSSLQEMSSNGAGCITGAMIGTGSKKGPWHGFDAEAFNKRQKADATLRGAKEFIGEEALVSEVMDYLLGISVG